MVLDAKSLGIKVSKKSAPIRAMHNIIRMTLDI